MNVSIFGSEAPKFNYNGIDVLLDNWVTLKFEPEGDNEVIQESEIEDKRNFITHNKFWIFEGLIDLYKYNSLSDIRTKFEEIYQYNHQDVVLYKYRDGFPFFTKDINEATFRLEMFPKDLDTLDCKDLLLLRFTSNEGIYFKTGLSVQVQTDDNDIAQMDDNDVTQTDNNP